jgi:RNA polymerase sigma factor (sigma-70 family)
MSVVVPLRTGKPRAVRREASKAAGADMSGEWEQLMARAQQGDQAAYHALLVAVTPYLRTIARRYLGPGADVEDAVQDILLTLHDIRHTYEPGRPFKSWLATIAQRRSVDLLRARIRRAHRHSAEHDAEHLTDDALTPEAAAIAGQQASLVRNAVGRLAPKQRQAVELVHLHELGIAGAAARADQPSNTLKVACHRALRQLHGMLKHTANRHD